MAADDRLGGARKVGSLNRTRTFKDSVGLRDKNDYYALKINGRSSLNLSLSNLQNDVDLSLVQNGRVIASSSRKKNQPEKITATLAPGAYYVRVYQKRGSSRYQLSLTATPLSQSIAPGQSPSADLFYNNVFLSGTSAAYDCGLNNNPTSCLEFQRISSILFSGCGQGNQTACSLLLQLTEIEATARIIGMIGAV